MKKVILSVICIALQVGIATNLYSQNIINGKLSNKEGKAWGANTIMLGDLSTGKMISHAFSDSHGNYKLTFNSKADSLFVTVSGLAIGTHRRDVKNISQKLDFIIAAQPIKLREVIVKAQEIKISGDTLSYNVASFLDDNDTVIEDIIKKLPGVSVSTEGVISYQGKQINKFYIENMDLLQGRYGIATKNISAKDIAKVEIMENHQPIKAMKGISHSDAAAMNLKLKENVKGVFMLTANLGAGAEVDGNSQPVLWDNTLTGMVFARKMQNMSQYKGNNAGYDVYKDLKSHTVRSFSGQDNMVSVAMPSPPSINIDRYLFNDTHSGAVNHLIRDKKGNDIVTNIIYLHDQTSRNSQARTTIYLPDSKQTIIDEQTSSTQDLNRLEANVRYESNQAGRYLNNNVTFKRDWVSSFGDVNNGNLIRQELTNPSIEIMENFNLFKVEDGKGYKISATGGFRRTPQSLTIYDGLYPDIFNGGEDYESIRQNLTMTSAYANVNLSLISAFSIVDVHVDPILRFGFDYSNLDSDIITWDEDQQPTPIASDDFKNNLDWNKYFVRTGATLRYEYKELKVNATLPISYNFIETTNRVTVLNDRHNLVWFEPSLNINYNVSQFLKLSANYGLNNSTANIKTLYTGAVLKDYRTVNRYDNLLPQTLSNSASASLEYRNLIDMFFAKTDISYFTTNNDMITQQHYDDILSITSMMNLENISSNIRSSVRLSKGFDFWSTLIAVEPSYSKYKSQQLRQDVLTDFDSDSYSVTSSLNIKPLSFLRIVYENRWNQTSSRVVGGATLDPIRSMVNEISVDVNMTKKWFVTLGCEAYYNSAALGDKNIYFADIAMTYKVKNIDMSLMWNNVLNNDTFTASRYSALDEYQYSYDIRPSNVMFQIKFKIF